MRLHAWMSICVSISSLPEHCSDAIQNLGSPSEPSPTTVLTTTTHDNRQHRRILPREPCQVSHGTLQSGRIWHATSQ